MSVSDQVTMFYNASPKIFERASALRKNMTTTELILWENLKCKKMLNLRFRAQHPIDIFIADFYCHPLKLVIEIDGGIHKSKDQREYDIRREAKLDKLGLQVVRFTNEEIEKDIRQVVNNIEKTCIKRSAELSSPL